ncbi:MAG TPA: hypothetical protein VL180_08845 [Burkholderiales bacterium]|jgi:hypothetical protein|nr:hypothetical protein [Burkholderiales bacterium]
MRLHGLQRFLAAALVLAMIPLAWWTITQGGPYLRAERFLHGHPAIESRIGRITSIRLAFRDYSFAPADDTAQLELLVTGERGNGFATVDLHWERGAWDVVSVKFRREGETVPVQTFPAEKPRRREMMWVASLARSRALPRRTA